MSELALAIVIIPICLMVVAVCWLLVGSRGGKPLNIRLKGLGVELSINQDKSPKQGDPNE